MKTNLILLIGASLLISNIVRSYETIAKRYNNQQEIDNLRVSLFLTNK